MHTKPKPTPWRKKMGLFSGASLLIAGNGKD